MGCMLTIKQQRFVDLYALSHNASQAYIDAGYSPNCADRGASNLLRVKAVQEALNEIWARARKRHDIQLDEIIARLVDLAKTAIDPKTGKIYVTDDISDPNLSIVSLTTSDKRNIQIPDKGKILVKLGEHLGGFSKKMHHKVDVSLTERMKCAEQRLKDDDASANILND